MLNVYKSENIQVYLCWWHWSIISLNFWL